MNAPKHGLTARTVVLSNENRGEYAVLRDSYVQHLHPTNPIEMDLVLEMVNAKWRQRRLLNIETELFEREMREQKKVYKSYSEIVEHTCAFKTLALSVSLQVLNRSQSRLERTYSRALNNLLRLRHVPKSNPASIVKDEKRTQCQGRRQGTNHHFPLLEAQLNRIPRLTSHPYRQPPENDTDPAGIS